MNAASETSDTISAAKAREVEIHFDGVSKYFGDFCAVENLTLDIYRGEMVAVLGKTGCGKSTMFNMIAGLQDPTQGLVRVQGGDPFRQFDAFRGKIAIVFQNDRLLPWRTAQQNVELGLEMLDTAPRERADIARRWLSQLGLAGHEDDYPHALSGGMRQRVSIARAFATDASILLCDEPFSALDEITANRLRGEFLDLVQANGKTGVFITHSINEALQIGERVLVLRRPARIALDERPPRGMSEDEAAAIRSRIQGVLSE